MAGARKAKKKQVVDSSLCKQIWGLMQDDSVCEEILKDADQSRTWEKRGKSFWTNCPYHADNDPSFSVNPKIGIAKCFGCDKWVSDPVQLIAKLRNCDYDAALIFLNDRLDLGKHFGKNLGKITEHHALEEMKKAAAVAFTQVVEEYVRDRPAHLDYMKTAAVYLEKARNVPVALLCNLPVSIFPKPEHAKKYMPSEHHDAYDKYFKAVNNQANWGAVVFWYNESPGIISRFKLRCKAADIKAVLAGDDVESLSANRARNLFAKSFVMVEDPVERPVGFFGLHHYSRLLGEKNTSVVITEGEFDALAVMVGQLKNGSAVDFPILATGGMGSTHFDLLRDYWVRTIYAVSDAPGDKRGDQIAYNWLCANKQVNTALEDKSFMFRVFLWPPVLSRDSGDLDEAVQNHGYELVRRLVWAEKDNTYLNRADWTNRKCTEELDAAIAAYESDREGLQGQETALLNLADKHNRKLREICAKWYKALSDNIEQQVFKNVFSAKLGFDLSALVDVYASINDVNTPLGAVAAVSEALFGIVSLPYYVSRNGKSYFTIYSKVTEEVIETPFTQDYGIEQTISKFVNGDMAEWMKRILRNASTITPSEEEREKYTNAMAIMAEEQKRAGQIMRKVITTNVHDIPNQNSLYKVGQGIHYKDLPNSTDTVYFVNGMKVFKGVINPESGAPISWTRIHDLRDGEYWFDCARNLEWSYTVQDVEALNDGMQVDISKVYRKITEVLDGWEFTDHDVMKRYIATWIMSLPIQLAIDRVTVTCITGESTSGKTSFLQGLLGGTKSSSSRIPSIVEPAKVVTDATEAYLSQTFDRTSTFVGIDEAETDDNTDHNRRVQNLIRMLFSVSTGGGDIGRGSANHSGSIEMKYKSPTLLAAIHLPTNEVFLTRTTIFYTKKNYKWKDIGDHINKTLGSTQALNELRRSITTGLLSRLDEIIEKSDALLDRLKAEETETKTTDRFRESVVVGLALYEMCGTPDDPHDPIKLYHDIVKANKERLETILAADMKHPLLDTILYTKCVPAFRVQGGPQELVAPRDLLMEGSRDDVDTLNSAKNGVYYLPEKEWIVLYWRQIRAGFLNSIPMYRDLSEGALRESISKNKYLVSDISEAEHRYIVNKIRIADAKMTAAYSVISMKYLVDMQEEQVPEAVYEGSETQFIDSGTF